MRHLTIFPSISPEDRSLKRYLSELNNIPLITAEEELRLARRIRQGDAAALDLLVRANLRFVVSVAKQYQHTDLALMDLISEGNIGLVQAAQRFDETKGFKFISYAVWWIRKSILAAISEQSRLIRLPGKRITAIYQAREMRSSLEQTLGREPTLEELSEALELRPFEVRELLELMPRRLSIHAPLEVRESPTLLDLLADRTGPQPDHQLVQVESLRLEIDRLLAGLSKREQRILRLRYGLGPAAGAFREVVHGATRAPFPTLPMSYEEIGKRVGLCAERVRMLKKRALVKLRLGV